MSQFENYEKLNKNAEKYGIFYRKLVEDNQKFNLTSVTEEKEAAFKHFIDSIYYCEKFNVGASVVEIGSGAGFPSVPIAIERPDLKMTLVEANNKKCIFLNEVKNLLGLDNVTVICERAEVLAKDNNYREFFDYAIARAVAPMRTLLEYTVPFIKVGGHGVFWKGQSGEEELSESGNALKVLGACFRQGKVYEYDLNEYGKRRLIVIDKISSTPPKYPRGQGKERKCPL